MRRRPRFTERFRLGGTAGADTLRAFSLFGVLLVVLGATAGHLMFRELSLQVLERRVDAGRDEAQRIASALAALGRAEDGLDYPQIRQRLAALRAIALERMAQRGYLRYVEVRDRFGVRLLWVARGETAPDQPWGALPTHTVRAQLLSGVRPEGEVRIGIAGEELQRELESLRASLRIKLLVALSVGIGALVLGLFYVLHLIRKNRDLERSRVDAERRAYVGLLASGLVHEIRNPLNAMNINLQLLEEELQEMRDGALESCRELLEATKQEIKRLEQLANNFLAYARPVPPRFAPSDLNALLRSVALFLQADFRQSGVHLELDLDPLLPSVEADETQLKQAIINLLINARQVLPSGGTARLVSRAGERGDVVVEVRDDGPGIPAEARERIFEVFYSKRGGGTGLGLPIARRIVEGHGGRIEVESEEGRGTTFRIHLPRRHTAPPEAPQAAEVTG